MPNTALQRTELEAVRRQEGTVVFVALVAAILSCGGWGHPAAVMQGGGAKLLVEAGLLAAAAERMKANLEGDTEKIAASMAEEHVQTDIVGRVQSKAQWLAEYFKPLAALIKAGQFHWDVWEERDVQIRPLGRTAVVVGSLTLKGTGASFVPGRGWVASPEGSVGPVVLRFTRVWIKRNGKWLLAAVHNALLPDQGGK